MQQIRELNTAYIPPDEHVAVSGELRVGQLYDLHDEEGVLLEPLTRQFRLHGHLVFVEDVVSCVAGW